MDKNPESPAPKKSPRFPSVDLAAAIAKAKTVWDNEGKHPVRTGALAAHWDLSEKSSGLRSYLATLGYFGLLEQVGNAGSGEYKLSDRAIKILAGEAEEREKALQEAALEPKLYRQILERFSGEIPSNENLESRLLIDYGFNKDSVTGFIKNFKSTLALAEVDKGVKLGGKTEGLIKMPHATERERVDSLMSSSQSPHMTANVRYLPIPLDIGNAPIPVGMSEDDFQLLKDTLDLWKSKIVRAPEPKPSQQSERE